MKQWKVGIVKDTTKKMLGLHGLQTAFRGLPNVEVCALVDRNLENITERMAFMGAQRHYEDMRAMLEAEHPDIVILTSRLPYDHLEQIRLAAEYHTNVYCEKSLVCEVEQGDEIIEIVEKSGIKVCVAHPCRYAEPFRTFKRLLESGEIGEPVSFTARGKCDNRGGGEDMIVLGTHIIDWLTFLFGHPLSVFADITMDGRPARKDDLRTTRENIGPVIGDHVFAGFGFSGGVKGVFESRHDLYDVKVGNTCMGLTVMGTRGALSLRFDDFFERKLFISRHALPPETEVDFELVPTPEIREIPGAQPIDYSVCEHKDCPRVPSFPESNRFAVWDLMQSIEENRQPVSNVWNAVETQEMIQGVYLSHLTGRRIYFPLSQRKHPLL